MKIFLLLITFSLSLTSNALAQPKCAEFTGNYTREIWFGNCKVNSQINRTVSGGESIQFIQNTFDAANPYFEFKRFYLDPSNTNNWNETFTTTSYIGAAQMVHKPHRKHIGAIVRTVEVPQWIWDVVEQNSQIFEPLYKDLAFRPIADVLEPKSPRFIAAQQQKRDAEQVAQRQQEQRQRDEQQKKDQAAAETAKLRTDIAKMNVGQLFAKADELSSSGESAKAREVLRSLVSRFPDHPLAAQAAAQMAGGAQSNAGQNTATSNSAGAVGNTGGGVKSTGNCEADRAAQGRDFTNLNRVPMPQGATPPFMRIMWMTSEAIKLLKASCPSTPAFQQEIASYEKAYRESETACNQLSAAKCVPNPYR